MRHFIPELLEVEMYSIVCRKSNMPALLRLMIFTDRGRQFVDRLKWDLCVSPQGFEIDEYDDEVSTYLAVHEMEYHLGSCRVRPITAPTMLLDHFSSTFPDARSFLQAQKGRLYELTRFLRSPGLSVTESKQMLLVLAAALDRFRDENRLSGYVAVVYPSVARFLDSIGVRYITVSQSTIADKTALMICITHCVKVSLPLPARYHSQGDHAIRDAA